MSGHDANDNDGTNDPLPKYSGARADLGKESLRPPLPKRFYRAATVAGLSCGFAILLDGRPVKTPGKTSLVLPTRALADAIAVEWGAQGERIDPATMPLTRLANTALDAVIAAMGPVADDIVAYAGSDALCYRAQGPVDLVARQATAWDGLLDWAARELGAPFIATAGILHAPQPALAGPAIARAIAPMDAWQLAPLHVMTTLMGSAILALAVARPHITARAAWDAAHVDEDWQITQWGPDEEAVRRRAQRWHEMAAAARFMMLARGEQSPES